LSARFSSGMSAGSSARGKALSARLSSEVSAESSARRQDFKLSKALTKDLGFDGDLGLDDGLGGGEEDGPAAAGTGRLNSRAAVSAWALPKAMQALNRFRQNLLQVSAPDERSLQRGVHIHDVYDFYVVSDKAKRLRRMGTEVFHHRIERVLTQEEDDGTSSAASSTRSRQTSPLDDDPAPAARDAEGTGAGPEEVLSPRSAQTLSPKSKAVPSKSRTPPIGSPRGRPRTSRAVRSPASPRSQIVSPGGGTPKSSPRGTPRGTQGGSPKMSPREGGESPRATRATPRSARREHRTTLLRLTKFESAVNPEIVARWGVIGGQILRRVVVLDFGGISSNLLVTKRLHRRSKEGNGVVFDSVRRRALAVISQAWELASSIPEEPQDVLDGEWRQACAIGPSGRRSTRSDLLTLLFSTEYIDTLALFAKTATKVLAVQPPLAMAGVPCRIFGDLHGQLRDMLLFFHAFGYPDEVDGPHFVFNGDFVDRGAHQLEVVGLLFALKVLLPEKVWLVRGNHEDRIMNQRYGFMEECTTRLGKELGGHVFELFHKAFDQLPLACLVAERVLVLHGGIGDGRWSLEDVRRIERPLTTAKLGTPELYWVNSMLWSDPVEDDDTNSDVGTFGVHESPRGARGALFGWDVTKTFCARNGLGLVVRSHQCKHDSCGIDVMHENNLIRVFSARDYEGHGNDGAVLFLERGGDEDDEGGGPLTVRPQVLRSTTKARKEQEQREQHKTEEAENGFVGGSGPLSLHGRRKSMRRKSQVAAQIRTLTGRATAA